MFFHTKCDKWVYDAKHHDIFSAKFIQVFCAFMRNFIANKLELVRSNLSFRRKKKNFHHRRPIDVLVWLTVWISVQTCLIHIRLNRFSLYVPKMTFSWSFAQKRKWSFDRMQRTNFRFFFSTKLFGITSYLGYCLYSVEFFRLMFQVLNWDHDKAFSKP